ncbi:MAG: patatin-like phospholipase family protein [Chromatiales bacterium]|nr:patatin-like phospholipase family protein [Gammaproteobacteria bacterium]MBW6476846.1 patatin-like phospholipase family protein [Chromatiales bacterium]
MKRVWHIGLLLVCLFGSAPMLAGSDRPLQAPPTVGLALGSGGAAGLAHIAMLQVFDELGVKPQHITGSSIGAVIGVLYAAGLSADQIHDIFADFDGSSLGALSRMVRPDARLGLTDLLRLNLGNGGLLDASGFLEFLASHIKARRFDELAIPLAIVATDYWTGEPVVISQGELLPALAASMAVPGLFAPQPSGERLLLDGGMSNPLPYNLLQGQVDIVVAIDVTGTRMRDEQDEVEISDLLFNTFKIMQQSIIRAQMAASRPDIYIKPDNNGIRLLHFNRIEAILTQAEPAAAELKQALLRRAGLGQR